MMEKKKLLAALALPFVIAIVPACEDEGGLEEAGEEIDESMEEAGEDMDTATENIGDELEDQ